MHFSYASSHFLYIPTYSRYRVPNINLARPRASPRASRPLITWALQDHLAPPWSGARYELRRLGVTLTLHCGRTMPKGTVE